VWTALSRGDGAFEPVRMVLSELCAARGWRVDRHPRLLADLSGDGAADLVGFGDDGVWVALSNRDGTFGPARFVLKELGFNPGWRVESHPRCAADLTGDGRADLIGFGNAGAWVALNTGDGGFVAEGYGVAEFGYDQGWRVDSHPRFVRDLTGDGRADILGFADDGVYVALGNGDGTFRAAARMIDGLGTKDGWRVDDHPRFLADTTGDGLPDVVAFGDAGVWVARNLGGGRFEPAHFVLADFGRRSNVDRVVRREVIVDHRQKDRIKHLFVLMLENRSYDHLLGFADITGTDPATGKPTKADGLDGTEFNTFQGRVHRVVRGAPDVTVAPGHDFAPVLEQLCGAGAVYPPGGPYPETNATGYVSSLHDPGVMRCFAPEHVPILTTLAREFAVCDRWFCSMPGPTEPNRYFLHAATSGAFDDSPEPWEIFEASNNHFGGVAFSGGTLFDALERAGVEHRIYAGDHFPVAGELKGVSNTFDVVPFGRFAADLQKPQFTPRFIHIEPKYLELDFHAGDPLHPSADFSKGNSQHPAGGVAAGERLIKATYEAIRNSPHWSSSMLIITYDEHGGFYDHVAPPACGRTGSTGRTHGFAFDQLGPRVPGIVISPLIPRNTVEHRLFEHCSVIKTACDLFGLPHLRRARDLKAVCGLLHLASLPSARADAPARLPNVVVSSLPRTAGSGQDSMIDTMLRSAAVRWIARDPAAQAAVLARVQAIRTDAEAAAFLQDAQARLKVTVPG
jgi:phospholipase C